MNPSETSIVSVRAVREAIAPHGAQHIGDHVMNIRLSERARRPDFQGAFLNMILRVAAAGKFISFAGGLPNPISFPVQELADAAQNVLRTKGERALQYNNPQGYEPLRQFIADRYAKKGLAITTRDILITNGSQQALEMIAATLIDDGDAIVVERPCYLAALQAFHLFNPVVRTVELTPEGAAPEELQGILERDRPKFFYSVPDFQNPTGLTYSATTRRRIAAAVRASDTFLIEDNPYEELRFRGESSPSFHALLGGQCLLAGSFSKIVSPGMRLGWIACTCTPLWEALLEYKQRVDLHTSVFSQMVLDEYLRNNDLESHILQIRELYRHQADVMLDALQRHFPAEASWTRPEGGMFIWATLPSGLSAVRLAEEAAKEGVMILAGDPFYEEDRNVPTFRLNYTNSSDEVIEKGIAVLGRIIHRMMAESAGAGA